jgi:hypothetical protein
VTPFLLLFALAIGFYVLWFIFILFLPFGGTANIGRRTEVPTDRRD